MSLRRPDWDHWAVALSVETVMDLRDQRGPQDDLELVNVNVKF